MTLSSDRQHTTDELVAAAHDAHARCFSTANVAVSSLIEHWKAKAQLGAYLTHLRSQLEPRQWLNILGRRCKWLAVRGGNAESIARTARRYQSWYRDVWPLIRGDLIRLEEMRKRTALSANDQSLIEITEEILKSIRAKKAVTTERAEIGYGESLLRAAKSIGSLIAKIEPQSMPMESRAQLKAELEPAARLYASL